MPRTEPHRNTSGPNSHGAAQLVFLQTSLLCALAQVQHFTRFLRLTIRPTTGIALRKRRRFETHLPPTSWPPSDAAHRTRRLRAPSPSHLAHFPPIQGEAAERGVFFGGVTDGRFSPPSESWIVPPRPISKRPHTPRAGSLYLCYALRIFRAVRVLRWGADALTLK